MHVIGGAATYADISNRLADRLPHGSPVSSWVPILMFTVLFGLSMDYEVFLLSRIRELVKR